METKVTERDDTTGGDPPWQRTRNEIEEQWYAALHSETSDFVPSKLPISLPPVRRAA